MNMLSKLAAFAVKLPIGGLYSKSDGTVGKIPKNKDNYFDFTNIFLTPDSAKPIIQKQISDLDTSDPIDDKTVSDKIDSLSALIDADDKANTSTTETPTE
ncbi:hypothetical protein [Companilactobacillus muriivasis]|uniref:hypothetical protein n=1 Tax=Companilactobacillus muriivasis TaxID=3081444 RepID=UPI0030C6E414